MFIAQRRLKVGHDEDTNRAVFREIGEAVPEAETWSWQMRATYLREGHLAQRPHSAPDQSPPAPTRRASKGQTHA